MNLGHYNKFEGKNTKNSKLPSVPIEKKTL